MTVVVPNNPSTPTETCLELPALEVRQGPNRRLYLLAVDGKRLDDFATVSRVHRDDHAQVRGYQRPEVISHITEIRRYLESTDPLVPNALVIAFDDTVAFTPASTIDNGRLLHPGHHSHPH